MPYDKDKNMIYTKLKGVAGWNMNVNNDPEDYSIYNPEHSQDPMTVCFTRFNYNHVNCFVSETLISNSENEAIKRMSYLLVAFLQKQKVLSYISNYPERVVRFYRKNNKDIFVRFIVYDNDMMDEKSEWTVNYYIGEIDYEKYRDIIDTNITGISNFFVTGVEKKENDSSIRLGLNIGIKIYV